MVSSALEYGFIGGSMGAVVGETIARAHRPLAGDAASADYCGGVGRRAHDGGDCVADAVGEDRLRAGAHG